MVKQQQPRYLITTANERTWKFDRPVVFLGEWCRLYERKHIWHAMDAIVASPYGLGQDKKDIDHSEARALEDMLFPMFCNTLNQHHGVQHNERFWRIILGHWLCRYVNVMLNRVKTLEQCFNTYQISGSTVYANDGYALATLDSNSAIWAFNDDRWNDALNARILVLLGLIHFPLETIEGEKSAGFRFNELGTRSTLKRAVLKWSKPRVGKCLSWFARDNDAFFINSYLPKKEEFKLQMALQQCPQLWNSPKLEVSVKPDRALRENLAYKIVNKSSRNNLEDILSIMLFELLPICYLEGFKNLDKLVKQQPWPKIPKFIFTSNNFDTDEVFKLWVATKVESGTKYYVGQHGNYGVSRNHIDPSNEEITADKFLTWGWKDGLPQHTPAFVFKTAGRKAGNYNSLGGLLLIEVCLNHRITTWDGTYEFGSYFKNQQNFVSALAFNPKLNLTIRLHGGYKFMNWNEEARWLAFDPSLRIDTGAGAISKIIENSRLVVHSYDSTGILETLSKNIPTLAFWQNGFEHLRETAKPYYQLLVDAGIVHFSPESVAAKVNEVWDDVDGWWGQSSVQYARKQFCERYARVSKKPVHELMLIFSS